LFLAVVANLRWLDREERAAATPAAAAQVRNSSRAWKVAMAAATLVTCYQLGPVFQPYTSRAGFLPLRVDINGAARLHHDNLEKLIAEIPPDASVAASEMLVAQVSSRKHAYTLMHGHYDADYILARFPPDGRDIDHLAAALRTGAYGLVDEKGVFALFRRGAPAATVQPYLLRIGARGQFPIK
jgi:hypothetical protein